MTIPVTVEVPIWWFLFVIPVVGAVAAHFAIHRWFWAWIVRLGTVGIAFAAISLGEYLPFGWAVAGVATVAVVGWMAPGLCALAFLVGGGYFVYQFFFL